MVEKRFFKSIPDQGILAEELSDGAWVPQDLKPEDLNDSAWVPQDLVVDESLPAPKNLVIKPEK